MTRKTHRYPALLLLCACSIFLLASRAAARQTPAKNVAKDKTEETATTGFEEMDSLLEFSTLPAAKTGEQTTKEKVEDLAKESMAVRDPFWPIGFKPEAQKPETKPTKPGEKKPPPKVVNKPRWEDAVRTLSIQGIMSVGGGKYMTVINGQVAGEGDRVSTTYKGRKYFWTVDTISERGVTFRKIGGKKPKKPEVEIVE